jgi:hypothetical protein
MTDLTSSAHHRLLAYAEVGSYGLAHSLLAWGRCRVWSDNNDVPMLAPDWLHFKHRIGPVLRRERDKRQYHRLFHFPGYITGSRRAWSLLTYERVSAEEVDLAKVSGGRIRSLVVFRNRMNLNEEVHFREIHGYGAKLCKDLLAMTKRQYRPAPYDVPHVALHVRMGDFALPSSLEELRKGCKNSRVPVSWYVGMLEGLRDRLGRLPARVISDGTDESLAPLLSMPEVERTPRQPSVTDLLAIAQAKLVISSGSGFSMWGAFLGDAPRICFPGQRFVRVLPSVSTLEREPEFEDASQFTTEFLDYVRERFHPHFAER